MTYYEQERIDAEYFLEVLHTLTNRHGYDFVSWLMSKELGALRSRYEGNEKRNIKIKPLVPRKEINAV